MNNKFFITHIFFEFTQCYRVYHSESIHNLFTFIGVNQYFLFQKTRSHLFGNIVLSGGNTMYPGFAGRLEREVAALAPPSCTPKVVTHPSGTNSAWLGGSIMASLPSFGQRCISKKEYEESGPSVVFRNCLPF